MSETRFTPGPWKSDFWGVVWRDPFKDSDGRIIHQPVCDATVPASLGLEERKANAHLIAAAPEMYAALNALCGVPDIAGWPEHRAGLDALSKAEGSVEMEDLGR